MFALSWLALPLPQWNGLICVSVATVATIVFFEGGRWRLGLFVPPRFASRELVEGLAWGVGIVGTCALVVVLSTDVRHERGAGFPWLELVTVFLPAVFHEELLFRGYPFQKLRTRSRALALILIALIFAALHANNTAVTMLALANVFLGGVLLGLAYERYERLWFPIGLHLAWNLMSGPILGHEVSGYSGATTVFVERGAGAVWLTGGEFGIEGSGVMTGVEIMAIAVFLRMKAEGRRQKAE
ncbi:MAG TPA: CPBP family intramembrane glutamic endopeptidase [Thermoanaerobaculia bacterium]|nr:CPBP family intramembrane glutamic endopeptidase [Thermoanaerobaculia bacterium]